MEYTIIDGGSSDGSREIVKKYEKELTYWISEPDDGQSQAINKGIARSTGEIITWLNSDDLLLPGSLSLVAAKFAKRKDIDVLFGDRFVIDG